MKHHSIVYIDDVEFDINFELSVWVRSIKKLKMVASSSRS